MKKICLLISFFITSIYSMAQYDYIQNLQLANSVPAEVYQGDTVVLDVTFSYYTSTFSPMNDTFRVYIYPSGKELLKISNDSLVSIPLIASGSAHVARIKVCVPTDYSGQAFLLINDEGVHHNTTVISNTPPTISTSTLSPTSPEQKEGMAYYYNYSGVLIGTAKTKEKPDIAEGLYIFRIEYTDNTFSSGKIVF